MKTFDSLANVTEPGEDEGWSSLDQQIRWAREHGPMYVRAVPGWGPTLTLVGAEANRFVLHTGREHFSHALGWTPVLGPDLGRGLLNMDDPDHARARKMWNPAFTSAAMEAYLPVLQQIVARQTADWVRHTQVDVYDQARQLTFAVAAVTLAGIHAPDEVASLGHLFSKLLGNVESEAEWQAVRVATVERVLALIDARRRTRGAAHDVISLIVHARDDLGRALSDMELIGHINILLIAGHETTTSLAAWALYELATRPEWVARLQAELAGLGVDRDHPLTVDSLRRAPLLEAFIKETGRLHSPVINVPRGTVSDFVFNDVRVPAGTPVRLALAAGHRLATAFVDPDRFDPDRFLVPRDEDRRTPYALATFGGGSRICIGINFATIELKALLAHVLTHYQLAPAHGHLPKTMGYWNAFLPEGLWLQVTAAGGR
jgi:cytochrome P450